jgi:hypothetical protein
VNKPTLEQYDYNEEDYFEAIIKYFKEENTELFSFNTNTIEYTTGHPFRRLRRVDIKSIRGSHI